MHSVDIANKANLGFFVYYIHLGTYKLLAFEFDPHLIYCVAIGLSHICASGTIVFHHNEEDEFFHIQFFSHMRVRSQIFVSYLDLLGVFLCLYVGSVVPGLCAA